MGIATVGVADPRYWARQADRPDEGHDTEGVCHTHLATPNHPPTTTLSPLVAKQAKLAVCGEQHVGARRPDAVCADCAVGSG